MKSIFSLAALVLALGLTAMLVKKQFAATVAPAAAPVATGTAVAPGGTPSTSANQVQQVGQQVQDLMQQPRPGASEP